MCIRDRYKRITAFAWGYYLTEAGNNTVYHVDIYTKETVYRVKRGKMGWEVEIKDNPIGKIPVLIFEQTPEHKEVQPMICLLYTSLLIIRMPQNGILFLFSLQR